MVVAVTTGTIAPVGAIAITGICGPTRTATILAAIKVVAIMVAMPLPSLAYHWYPWHITGISLASLAYHWHITGIIGIIGITGITGIIGMLPWTALPWSPRSKLAITGIVAIIGTVAIIGEIVPHRHERHTHTPGYVSRKRRALA
jgi:hypothetical protein